MAPFPHFVLIVFSEAAEVSAAVFHHSCYTARDHHLKHLSYIIGPSRLKSQH